jgi:hypothetical protein
VDSRSPDPSAPSPAFGSAIFTFSSSLDRPRINAHVSVLFLDEAPSDSEELRGKQQQHQNEGSAFVEEVPGRVAEQGPTLPEASTSKARDVNPVPHPVAAEDEESWGVPSGRRVTGEVASPPLNSTVSSPLQVLFWLSAHIISLSFWSCLILPRRGIISMFLWSCLLLPLRGINLLTGPILRCPCAGSLCW